MAMRRDSSSSASKGLISDMEDASTPMSSHSGLSDPMRSQKRKRVEDQEPEPEVLDEMRPVFLKMSFKKGSDVEEIDDKVEDDATFYARPWQERDTMVPSILAFRLQFNDLFDGVPDMGPQDIEEGLQGDTPSREVQELMCRLLTLAANRSRMVEYPQYNRPLNDCVAVHYATRGDPKWEGANPLGAMKRFNDLDPDDRLRLMYCLLDWALTESKTVREKIDEAYKNRTAPKLSTPNPYELRVIGRDDRKHGYYLLKGINTRFRLYIETDSAKTPSRWYSICSTLEELRKFTSDLSDSARTVRCRKIVDDLASIHIPEVERAEEVRMQLLTRKQRAEHERNRRHAQASAMAEVHAERSTRTRGRRVDYNSMLEGNGDDFDLDTHSTRSSRPLTPEGQVPHSSRSGRTIRRPRDWDDDASPDTDTRIALANSLSDTQYDPTSQSAESESHIVILKYDLDKFKAQLKTPLSEGRVSAQANQQNLAINDLAKRPNNQNSLSGGPQNSTGQDTTAQPNSNTGSESATRPTEDAITGKFGEQSAKVESKTAVETKLATRQKLEGRCLIIATIRDIEAKNNFLDNSIESVMEAAAYHGLVQLDILLYTNSYTQPILRSSAYFSQLQKALSAVYIAATKYSKQHGLELNINVIFNDWCGYNLAQEDIIWATIVAAANDRNLVEKFVKFHRDTYPDRSIPEINIHTESELVDSTTRPINPPHSREYDIVAVGGTFDHLHAGHKILLTMSAWLAQAKLVCGITDDALLVNKKYKEVMQNISERTSDTKAFLHRVKRGITYQFVPINDVAGPTGSDATIQALVASRETEAGSAQIAEIRAQKNLPPLDVLFIDVVGPDGEVAGEEMARLKLSSTAIRERLLSKI